MLTEFLGYISSAVLLISFLFSDAKKLRIINSVGCILFVIYGLMIDSLPVVLTNVSIVLINLYHLFVKK